MILWKRKKGVKKRKQRRAAGSSSCDPVKKAKSVKDVEDRDCTVNSSESAAIASYHGGSSYKKQVRSCSVARLLPHIPVAALPLYGSLFHVLYFGFSMVQYSESILGAIFPAQMRRQLLPEALVLSTMSELKECR